MAGRQAKLLTDSDLKSLLRRVATGRYPDRDRVIVLLSAQAGLRAGEIAGLTWPMVLDNRRRVGRVIALEDRIAKKGSGRTIPLHPDLRKALTCLAVTAREHYGLDGPIILSERGGPMRPNSIVNWFVTHYAALGLTGCSSHSGRRTFITKAARLVHKAGGSLRDVQELAGHKSISMTQRYIDGDTNAKRRLVQLL